MNEVYSQVIAGVTAVWRRRWYVAAIAWLICGAGWTMVASLPDKYQSSARIYIDMDTLLGPLMRGLAVETNLFQQIDLMQRTLFSRPNLEKIALLTDLDLRVTTPEEKDTLLEGLRKMLSIEQQGRNLFRVGYEDVDRQLTKRVVQAVLQIFVEGNLGASRKDMDTSSRFLQDQIADYEKQLEAAESRLSDFRRRNMGFLPGDRTYHQQMMALAGEVERTQAFLVEATKMRDSLHKQLSEVPQFYDTPKTDPRFLAMAQSDTEAAGPESDINLRIYDMQKTVDMLLMRYTDNHPDVVIARKRIEELKAQQKKELEERLAVAAQNDQDKPDTQSQNDKVSNPVYEQIKLQLVRQEAVVAALQERLVTKKGEHAKWLNLADQAPQVEAELVRLNRDYDIIRSGYQQLRSRQESAKFARELETKAQKVQFRIIDPPSLPSKPSGPNRPFFLSLVLVAGISAGLAFAFLLGQINTTFGSVQALRNTFLLPVVGSVTAISSASDRWRRRRELFSFTLVSFGLFAAFGGLVTVEFLHKL